MKVKTFLLLMVFAFGASLSAIQSPAFAQLTIQLGGSGAEIKQFLNTRGYSDIKITKRSFAASNVEACLEGIRYRMNILFTGQIKWRTEIGKCRTQVSIDTARQLLRKKGYRRIDLEERRGGYVAIACLDGRRLRVNVDQYGDIRQDRRLGRCQTEARSPTDVKADLEQQGYSRIKFTDRQLPRYVAEACRGLQKVELVLSRIGEIRQETRIGRCQRAIDPGDIPQILAKNGYQRIRVIDSKLPRYVVEACRRNREIELTLNRFGSIIDQFEIGSCARPLSRQQLVKSLAKNGFSRIKVIRKNDHGYVVEVCRERKQQRFSVNDYGELLSKKNLGPCRSRPVKEIIDTLNQRGMKNVKFYAVGCRKGRNIRIQFNRLGDPTGRERLGRC